MIAVGGDEHLPVATYYDVPVISLRPVLLPLLLKVSLPGVSKTYPEKRS